VYTHLAPPYLTGESVVDSVGRLDETADLVCFMPSFPTCELLAVLMTCILKTMRNITTMPMIGLIVNTLHCCDSPRTPQTELHEGFAGLVTK
ncbi:hypothetical protein OS493_040307, partial [Desmophyllum pertusum]